MFARRRLIVLAAALLVGMGTARAAEEPRVEPKLGDDGLYTQAWFAQTFLDLNEDLKDAAAQGKRLAVLWEQKGCPYCKETHTINFANKTVNDYVRQNFVVIQLNLWGDREVTDFDGQKMAEKQLAKKWGVVFTPTIHFFVEPKELKAGKPGIEQTASVMPGYFKPFHFLAMFEYVKDRLYDKQHFQKYIADKVEHLRAQGKEVKVW